MLYIFNKTDGANKDTTSKEKKMENKTNKEQRVVLNLSMDQAKQLNTYFLEHGGAISMLKIQQRIEKTINKHENSEHCKYCGDLSKGEYCSKNCAGLDEKEHEAGRKIAEAMGVTGPDGN